MSSPPDPEGTKDLWLSTLGVDSLVGLDARATYKPNFDDLAELLGETLAAPADASAAERTPARQPAQPAQPVGAHITFAWADAVGSTVAPSDPAPDLPLEFGETADPETDPPLGLGETVAPDPYPAVAPPHTSSLAPPVVPGTDGPAPPHYRVVGEIGRGGMGVVYRVEQRSLNREVALKMVLPHVDGAWRSKFKGEALVTGCLEHPNIVPVHELVEAGSGDAAFVMKLVGGRPWEAKFEEGAETLEHLNILLSVCNALEYAHSKSLAHLDLKPENVMVGEFGEVVVMDWGLAVDFGDPPKHAGVAPHATEVRTPCGTPCYMAPELATGRGADIGPGTDIYLLGSILHHILSGRPPHDGADLAEALQVASQARAPEFDLSVPSALQAVCRRAMARDPGDRFETVRAFRQAIEEYLEHRESLLLSTMARKTLRACQAMRRDEVSHAAGGAQRRYAELSEALSGFRQARLLWEESPSALEGEIETRQAFVAEALEQGDLGLAQAHATELPPEGVQRDALLQQIQDAHRVREERDRTSRWVRRGLVAAIVIIVGGLALGYRALDVERRKSEASAELAEGRLADIQRLSDAEKVDALEAQAATLWPALPSKVSEMTAWLEDARTLAITLPTHHQHLGRLRQGGVRGEGDRWTLPGAAEQWEHDTLAAMVEAIAKLQKGAVADIEARREQARTLKKRSIDDHRGAWDQAIAAIAAAPVYGGLRIRPQLGLVPLGPDPTSGLWEFVHVQSGSLADRDAGGHVRPSPEMGVVLVLLPGGSFSMGVTKPTAKRPVGGPNVDPDGRSSEGPVHEIALAPFFMGKHELTQGQWRRFTGENPAAYLPGSAFGGRKVTLAHPVEQVRWREARAVLQHMDLQLPTEAQWEYASRAGTSTVYWTGDDKRSLQGAVNIADRYCMTHEGPGSWRYEDWLDDGYTVHAPVGTYRANGFGLHDTAGNVWEWVEDRYGGFDLGVRPGDGLRASPEGAPRVFRGGGFRAAKVHARSADRYSLYAHEFRAYDVGVRGARRVDLADQ